MPIDTIGENDARFLVRLFEKTGGKTSGSTSMYDIGAGLGLEKDAARQITETLMSEGLVEIRSLSGGIAITEDGIEAARSRGAGGETSAGARLTQAPVLDGPGRESVEALTGFLKVHAGKPAPAFDRLAELVADLRTIDAQMASPRPKTAVLRACFESIRSLLQSAGAKDGLEKIEQLLGTGR